jgi:hypothetical protein
MRFPLWLNWFSDRRRSPRMRLDNLIAVYWEGVPDCSHAVKEINLEGARIESATNWTEGTLIRLNLAVPQGDEVSAKSEAILNLWSRVVRRIPDGFCVEFIYENRDERRQLNRFLKGLYGKHTRGNENAKIAPAQLQGPGHD